MNAPRLGWLTWISMAALLAAAAVLSFAALRDLAELCGVEPTLAWLLPISVDAGAAVSTAAGLVVSAREQRAAGHDLLVDVRAIMASRGVGWMWTQQLAPELAALDLSTYEGITAAVVGKMLAARGCPPGQINRVGADGVRHNWQGVELTQIAEAQDGRTTS